MATTRTASSHQRDFVIPTTFDLFTPHGLVEYVQPPEDPEDSAEFPNRLALALYLRGHDIASTGMHLKFSEPRWASFGTIHTPFPVEPKATG